jgi:hypothetical protein
VSGCCLKFRSWNVLHIRVVCRPGLAFGILGPISNDWSLYKYIFGKASVTAYIVLRISHAQDLKSLVQNLFAELGLYEGVSVVIRKNPPAMLGDCHISEDAMQSNVGQYLTLKAMILLSMTSKNLRDFVDSRFTESFVSHIQKYMMSVHMFTNLSISCSGPLSADGKIVYEASKKSLTGEEQLQTLLAFHTIDAMKIPMAVTTWKDDEMYQFRNFEIVAAYMPTQKAENHKKHKNVRVYTFCLKSTETDKYVDREFGRAIEQPDTILWLEVKNAIVRDNMNLRKYYTDNCLIWCGLCNRNIAFYITHEELKMVERRKVCTACLREFCVSLKALKNYGMRFNKEQAKKDVKDIEILYVGKRGRAASVCKMMYKQDLAKLAGFSDWGTMVLTWPAVLSTRRLKKKTTGNLISK